MRSKGVINVIELAIVIVTLFVSFSVFFPGTSYRNKWDDAYGMLKARDAVLALERIGRLHEYSFSGTQMDKFLNNLTAGSNVIVWHSVSGGIKEETKIACACPADVVAWLNNWAGRTTLNNRNVSMTFCSAVIDPADACFASSDALLVWGYRSLQPSYSIITDYVSKGGGLVEVVDFSQASQISSESVQSGVVGLSWASLTFAAAQRSVFARTPRSTSDIIYEPYKYFHHIPITLKIASFGQNISNCTYNPTGNGILVLKGVPYEFDTCNASSAWFDTDGTGGWDTLVNKSNTTSIGGSNVTLNYVNGVSSISVSFAPPHVFGDILSYQSSGSPNAPYIKPADNNSDRVLVQAIFAGSAPQPAVIIGSYGSGRTAWMPEFGKDALNDDEKALLMSLLLWAANKEPSTAGTDISSFRAGYMTSYINVKNYDMFEIYKLNLGIGYPV